MVTIGSSGVRTLPSLQRLNGELVYQEDYQVASFFRFRACRQALVLPFEAFEGTGFWALRRLE
jgi:hypothetical protein